MTSEDGHATTACECAGALTRQRRLAPRIQAIKSRVVSPCARGKSFSEVQQLNRRLYRAYLLKESLARGMDYRQPARASEHLDGGCQWAVRSKLKSFVRLARTVRRHKQGIVAYSQTGLSNGVVEWLNNKIRLVMRRAYGFRNTAALKAMILLCCGGLTLHPPLPGFV